MHGLGDDAGDSGAAIDSHVGPGEVGGSDVKEGHGQDTMVRADVDRVHAVEARAADSPTASLIGASQTLLGRHGNPGRSKTSEWSVPVCLMTYWSSTHR